jgi:hypothetical protein
MFASTSAATNRAIEENTRLSQSYAQIAAELERVRSGQERVRQGLIEGGLSRNRAAGLLRARQNGDETGYIERQLMELRRDTGGQTREQAETASDNAYTMLGESQTGNRRAIEERRRRQLRAQGFTEAELYEASRGGTLGQENISDEDRRRISDIPRIMRQEMEILEARLRDIQGGAGAPQPGGGAGGSAGGSSSEFRGTMRTPKAELSNIAEVWKRIQTAQQDTPEARILAQQLSVMNQIAQNTTPRPDGQPVIANQ